MGSARHMTQVLWPTEANPGNVKCNNSERPAPSPSGASFDTPQQQVSDLSALLQPDPILRCDKRCSCADRRPLNQPSKHRAPSSGRAFHPHQPLRRALEQDPLLPLRFIGTSPFRAEPRALLSITSTVRDRPDRAIRGFGHCLAPAGRDEEHFRSGGGDAAPGWTGSSGPAHTQA